MTAEDFGFNYNFDKDFRNEVLVFSKEILSAADSSIFELVSNYMDDLRVLNETTNTQPQDYIDFYSTHQMEESNFTKYDELMHTVSNAFIKQSLTKDSVNYYRHDNTIVFDSDKILYPYPTI